MKTIVVNLYDEAFNFGHVIKLVTGWMINCAFLMGKFQGMLPNPNKKGQMGLRNIRTGFFVSLPNSSQGRLG
ncbi:MAG: hypothetical protein H0W49_04945 [Nitrospirales bacterium]|nr:hypothetical protein [Nitrospirales bacterium]